jgi:hypothetical protein
MHIAKLLSECIRNGIVDLADNALGGLELVSRRLLVYVEHKGDMAQHGIARFGAYDEGVIRSEVKSEICQGLRLHQEADLTNGGSWQKRDFPHCSAKNVVNLYY